MTTNFEKTNISYLLRSRRFIVIAVGLGLVAVSLLAFVIVPQTQSLLSFNQERTKNKTMLAKLLAKQQTLAEITTESIYQEADDINRSLPSQKPLLEFMNSMDTRAREAEIIIEEISLNPGLISTQSATTQVSGRAKSRAGTATTQTASRGPYSTLDVQLTVSGDLQKINTFLRFIEMTAPLTNVTSITLSEQRSSRPQLGVGTDLAEVLKTTPFKAELIISTYYFTQSVASAVESDLPKIGASEQTALQTISTFLYPEFDKQQQIRVSNVLDLFQLGIETAEADESVLSQ